MGIFAKSNLITFIPHGDVVTRWGVHRMSRCYSELPRTAHQIGVGFKACPKESQQQTQTAEPQKPCRVPGSNMPIPLGTYAKGAMGRQRRCGSSPGRRMGSRFRGLLRPHCPRRKNPFEVHIRNPIPRKSLRKAHHCN